MPRPQASTSLSPSKPFLIAAALLAAGLSAACEGHPTPEDRQRLRALRERLGASYTFKFEGPVYLRVQSRTEVEPSREGLPTLFSTFWLESDGRPRRDSNFVYLNAYNKEGDWLIQLYWDPNARTVVAARGREHY